MGVIVAIGGGEIAERETLTVDRRIVELTGEDHPSALFIPTASDDAEGYVETFHEVYGEELGCDTYVLELVSGDSEKDEVHEKIGSADLVYVGGGNTRKMMRVWKENGVDELLKEAYRDGTVLSGLSAGAICWFEAGHSDSESFEAEDEEWEYVRVEGLNMVENTIFCPHYHSENRVEPFKEFMRGFPGKKGLAVDDRAAVEIVDSGMRVLSAGGESCAYKVFLEEGEIVEKKLEPGFETDISEL